MSYNTDGDNLRIGSGTFAFDSGSGLILLGECSQAELQTQLERKEHFTQAKKSRTKIASTVTQQTHMLNVQMMEFVPENWALATNGSVAALSQTGSTVSAETLAAAAKLGAVYQTAKLNISAWSLKVAAVPLVEGVDFKVINARYGAIQLLPGATNVTDGAAVTIDYTAGTVDGKSVAAGVVNETIGKLVWFGDSTAGKSERITFHKAKISPNGTLALLSDDYANLPVQIEILDDSANNPASPLYLIEQF